MAGLYDPSVNPRHGQRDSEYSWPLVLSGIAIGLLYAPYAEGWVLARLWSWYAVPLGLHALSWKVCAAAVLAASLFQQRAARKESPSDYASRLMLAVLLPWLVLLVGWLPL